MDNIDGTCDELSSETENKHLLEEISRLNDQIKAQEKILVEQSLAVQDMRLIFEQSARVAKVGIWQCTLPDQRLHWTDFVYDIFGLQRGSPLTRENTLALYTEASRQELELRRTQAINDRSGFSLDAEIVLSTGEHKWVRLTASVECENGVPVRLFGMKQDITAQKLMFDRAIHDAEHDKLTGLVNKYRFNQMLEELCLAPNRGGIKACLLLIDLDGFKDINDRLGHLAGDRCIMQMAVRIKKTCRESDIVARIGGDEFAILAPGITCPDDVVRLSEKLLSEFRMPVEFNGDSISITGSIGSALLIDETDTEIFTLADNALYAAKAAGRDAYRLHEE
ncbi:MULTISPECIES: sensor domain-containing diguanylate cyclase [unclassified Ochrobactrum]|uniref:GGDEF domain-containing protein n=1 Tax=unclassified Ochrobactrum TaxID=239106 RepID=UPI0015FB4900|nr:diguanylate cyclase (GGDEF)-like protein [Ochrobactrum sp. RH2CCR150]MDH7788638.1 diguanylate cyclase (GGDEF)-like protein [Ochrobactrum sp. 19YEA23]